MGQPRRVKALLNLLDQGINRTSQLRQRSHTHLLHTQIHTDTHTHLSKHHTLTFRPGVVNRICSKKSPTVLKWKVIKTELTVFYGTCRKIAAVLLFEIERQFVSLRINNNTDHLIFPFYSLVYFHVDWSIRDAIIRPAKLVHRGLDQPITNTAILKHLCNIARHNGF